MYGTGWDVCDLDVIGWDEKGLKMDQLVGRLTGWWDMRSITGNVQANGREKRADADNTAE